MTTVSKNWAKSEVRAVIRFLHASGNSTKIHSKIVSDHGKDISIIVVLYVQDGFFFCCS